MFNTRAAKTICHHLLTSLGTSRVSFMAPLRHEVPIVFI